MPYLTLPIVEGGAFLELEVSASLPRIKALQAAGRVTPTPVRIRGLIDTGASGTAIDPDSLKALQLSPTGQIPIHTPSTRGAPVAFDQYDVMLRLLHPKLSIYFQALPVIAAKVEAQGFQALIGRDVLKECLFVYNGAANIFSLAF